MSIQQEDFDYLRSLVRQRTALVLTDDKAYLAESRLHGIARERGAKSVQELLRSLRSLPEGPVHQQVVDAMMTHETLFFRDGWPFEVLASRVFPDLRARRPGERVLHLWSAACSTGQEAYSLAITAAAYGWANVGVEVKILATDVAASVLDRTREGRYGAVEVERGLDGAKRSLYFRQVGSEWQARDELRAMVRTQHLNLAEPWPALPRMDVVFMRNVLIYFDLETRREILGRLHRVLRQDGYLFLGGSENILDLQTLFERHSEGRYFFYRPRTLGTRTRTERLALRCP